MSDVSFRQDVYVYNESTGFVVTSARQGGRWADRLDDLKAARKGVKSGAFVALELFQDDPFLVRVLVDGELTPEEQESWVDQLTARLNVSDGRLALCGGIEFLLGDADEDDDFVRMIKLPRGEYRADLYTMLPGVNGFYGSTGLEHLAGYWQETRPEEEPPAWVTDSTVDDPPRFVDFILHLRPVSGDIPDPVFLEGEYWFPIEVNRRTPLRCPTGIQSVAPILGDDCAE